MWRTKEMMEKEEQRRWKKVEDEDIRRWKKQGEDDIGRWKKEDESRWKTTQEEDQEEDEEEAERSAANLDYAAGCGGLGVRRRSTFRC